MVPVYNLHGAIFQHTGDTVSETAGTLIGYARVSTVEQSLDMQIDALIRHGVAPEDIFSEKVSGVAKRRPGRDKAIRQCRRGDTLVVWKLDRFGRSLLDILQLMQQLERDGVGFRSLNDQIDTTTPAGRVMLAMLGAFAQFERDVIQQRVKEGVAAAKARGVRFGKARFITPERDAEIERRIADGERVEDIALSMGIVPATIRQYFKSDRLERIRAEAAKRKG